MYKFDVRRIDNIDNLFNFINFLRDSNVPYDNRFTRAFHFLSHVCHPDHKTGSNLSMAKVLEMKGSKLKTVEAAKKLAVEFIKDLRKNMSGIEEMKKATNNVLNNYIALPARHIVGLLTGKTKKVKSEYLKIKVTNKKRFINKIANTILKFINRVNDLNIIDKIKNTLKTTKRINNPTNKSDRGPPIRINNQ